jgi:hypothetical protein
MVLFLLLGIWRATAFYQPKQMRDTTPTSTPQQALAYIESIDSLPQSKYWPNISPSLFLQNIQQNIKQPLHIYEGISTNFCGYASLSYLVLHTNPLGYVKLMLGLYKNGKAGMRSVTFNPSHKIMQVAGTLRFKGALDIRPADQLWFLCLADHFKGYLNFFSGRYRKDGDEDRLWASVNYAKFNRMAKKLLNLKIEAAGSDLMRPWIHDLYGYLQQRVSTGTVVLYLNNTYLAKKSHTTLKLGVPTHYVILEKISQDQTGLITFVYWDYGARSLRQVSPAFLKKIVFGISHCTLKKGYAQ